MKWMQPLSRIAMGIAALCLTAGWAIAEQWPEDKTTIKVISPSPGASVHMVQVGIGQAVEKFSPVENWIVQPLGGPKLWLPMMRAGQCDFANHSAADILNAYLGRGLYEDMGPQPIRLCAAGHEYMFAFWTTPKTGIETLQDLKGKVAYIKFKANPMFTQMAQTQLASVGLTFDDLKSVLAFSSVKDAMRQLIEGKVDAMLFPVVPGAVMRINEAVGECKFVQLTPEQAQYVVEQMPGYYLEDIPANDSRFRNKSAVPNAVCYQNAMITSQEMDEEVVYQIVKALYDHNDVYAGSHPACKYWSIDHKPISRTVPYHPGAIRYFKEKGIWTAEDQAYQEKMLEMKK